MDFTSFAEELQDHSAAPRLCPDRLNARDYTTCLFAKTVVGIDPNSETWVAVQVSCKRWGCAYCSTRKIRRLAWMCRNAEPNRLLTLTHSDKEWQPAEIDTPDGPKQIGAGENCWRALSKAFPELIRFLRAELGECEYLRVLELQGNGMPHFHCMLRSAFLPQGKVLAEWRRLCGRAGVNLKKIDSSFKTFRYLVKYLTKLHKIEWTDRHVSYSRNFFRPEDKEETAYAKLDRIQKYDQHPFVFLRERYAWETVGVLAEGKWSLPCEVPDYDRKVDPVSLGLPGPPPPEPELPLSQRLVPGMCERDLVNENEHLRPDGSRKRRRRDLPEGSHSTAEPAARDPDSF